ncbi:MAG: YlmH/Sll1252 family protein [Clostridia bacterium]|nr:YlmH/Sll1252 family protein [Clostridia bacterium]
MMNRESLLKRATKSEDKVFIAKILDKAFRTEKYKEVTNSDFLDPYQRKLVENVVSDCKELNYSFFGGYDGAERQIVFFRPTFMSDEPEESLGKLSLLRITLNSRENLSHRDYLGSLMGLGIKREKIGDILVKEESCDVVVFTEIADYISMNLQKVGNAKVETSVIEIRELQTSQPKVKEISATVASLRLDSVASYGYGMSRSKMLEYIKADKVSLNWETTNSPTKLVKAGDTISIRGKGRVVVDSIGGLTKKGRVGIILKKFIG